MIGLFVGVLGIWGFLLTLLAFSSGAMSALLCLVVGWAPLGLLVWFRRARAKSFEAVHAALFDSGGDHARSWVRSRGGRDGNRDQPRG